MAETIGTTAKGVTRNDLVVVHTRAGKLVKGYLQWLAASLSQYSLPPLPDVLAIGHELNDEVTSVDLADVKAVFFVRTREGNGDYSEVKFFADETVPELWVQVRLADGEALEGRVENSSSLLFEQGLWLRPTDCLGNNLMVFVPRISVVDFHVMGFAAARKQM